MHPPDLVGQAATVPIHLAAEIARANPAFGCFGQRDEQRVAEVLTNAAKHAQALVVHVGQRVFWNKGYLIAGWNLEFAANGKRR